MAGCCDDTALALQQSQRSTLIWVLVINTVMFGVMVVVALMADSSAMFADSIDNLGDAVTYGLSLMVIAGSTSAKARVALFKGGLIFMAAMLVAGQLIFSLLQGGVPVFELMGIFSLIALIANSACLALLWRHRETDVNMSSVWECSRNDILGNVSVFVAAGAVWLFGSGWPDLLVAAGLVILLLRSSMRVIQNARAELALAAHQ